MKNGFSLLELIITVSVISIIAAIGYPSIDNFGKVENYESDLATIRGQINIVRQISLENGHAYRLKVVNDDTNNNSSLEVWKAQGLNRFNTEYHKSTNPPCSSFGGDNENGIQETELTKELQYFTIKKCNSLSGNCNPVGAAVNYFCFLPDGSSPQNIKATIEAAGNAGDKSEFIHFYKSGFFNNGERM
jgi:prepilin-type N-terminal cleavage/methylation domain-containing protein